MSINITGNVSPNEQQAYVHYLENKYNRKLKSLDIKIDGDFADHLRFQTNPPFQAPYRPAACFSFS